MRAAFRLQDLTGVTVATHIALAYMLALSKRQSHAGSRCCSCKQRPAAPSPACCPVLNPGKRKHVLLLLRPVLAAWLAIRQSNLRQRAAQASKPLVTAKQRPSSVLRKPPPSHQHVVAEATSRGSAAVASSKMPRQRAIKVQGSHHLQSSKHCARAGAAGALLPSGSFHRRAGAAVEEARCAHAHPADFSINAGCQIPYETNLHVML